MVDFKRLTSKARELVERRGGTESLKEDAAELQGIAKGKGSLGDKAKSAAQAIKEPGAGEASDGRAAAGEADRGPAVAGTPEPEREPASERVEGEQGGKRESGA